MITYSGISALKCHLAHMILLLEVIPFICILGYTGTKREMNEERLMSEVDNFLEDKSKLQRVKAL